MKVPLEDEVLPAGRDRIGAGPLADDADDAPGPSRFRPHVDALDPGGPRVPQLILKF
jgi:hypothetical protein